MDKDSTAPKQPRVSRKRFLGQASAATVTLGLAACGGAGGRTEPMARPDADVNASAFPPLPPASHPLLCDIRAFFSREESLTVEAFTARLIPGSPADPGAREACVTSYIDQKLATFESFATPTYVHAPYAKPTTGPIPVAQRSKKTLLVAKDEAYRYGFQGSQTPQDAYRAGIAQLDAYSRQRYGLPFFELSDAQADAVITLLQSNDPEGPPATRNKPDVKAIAKVFVKPSAFAFFSMLQNDTNEGMFADPVYGGNRDFAGWKLVDYPGAQRAWTPDELRFGPRPRPIQGLRELAPMHPGHPAKGAILPIVGSDGP
jgi:gluconate 2-dehydrogenase gamma chain